MEQFGDAIAYFKPVLVDYYLSFAPGTDPESITEEKLRTIANFYGRERLIAEYEEEMASIFNQFDEEDAAARALDEDLASDEGRSWGHDSPVDKWRNINNLFKLTKTAERNIKKFNSTEYRYEVDIASLPCILSPEDSISILPSILDCVLKLCMESFDPNDRIVLSLDCAQLDPAIYLTMRRLADFNIEALMQKVALLNSQNKLCVDGSFRIRIFRIALPSGGSGKRKNIHVDRDRKRFANSVVTVAVNDNLCLPAALVLGKFRLTHDIKSGESGYSEWKSLRDSRQPKKLTRLAAATAVECGLTVGSKMNLDDLVVLQEKCFSEFQIKVISSDNGDVVVASIPEKKMADQQIIHLLHGRSHFDLITTPSGFFRSSYFCEFCDKPFSKKAEHRCAGTCGLCYRFKEECGRTEPMKCDKCDRSFNNPTCFSIHMQPRTNGLAYCDNYFVCKLCKVFVNLKNRREEDPKHVCGEMKCPTCDTWVDQASHKCYLKILSPEPIDEKPRYIFFDYETFDTPEGHVPNMVVAQYADGTEFRFPKDGESLHNYEKNMKNFGEWLFSEKHKGYSIIALNLRSYDGHFILRHMLDNNMKGIKVIKRGNQMLDIQYKSLEMNARDTLNFVMIGLAGFPKAVGLEEPDQKGDFPHRANVAENWDKVIPFPEIDKYMVDKLKKWKRNEFAVWHEEEKMRCNGEFDLNVQLATYCSNDVTVLRKCTLKFRNNLIVSNKLDPLKSVTIASHCQKYFRTFVMKSDEIAVISAHGYQANRRTSMEATQWLEWENMSADGRIVHGRNGKEQRFGKYFVDGVDEKKKTMYEYNGCVFHGHPECTDEEDRVPFGNQTMKEVFEEHEVKVEFLRSLGYEVEVKWSCDWLRERKDLDIKHFLLNMNLRDPLSPQATFKGGRTNAARLYYEVKSGEKILHYDIVSLYLTVNKKAEYPVGHPEIIVSNFSDVKNYFGFVSCKVLAPGDLLYPVLPMTMDGKLVFPLCQKCATDKVQGYCQHSDEERCMEGVWVTPELHYAIEQGYKVIEIYEVWHWKEKKTGLFADYVNHFLKEKIEASGWPKDCDTDEKKEAHVRLVKDKEEIIVDPLKVEDNPGRRAAAKLMLNSFWGKFGQRDNLCQTSFVHSPKKFYDLIRSEAVDIHDVFAASPECMMVTTSQRDDYNEGNNGTNIAIASFTTSWARLMLLRTMEKLGERLLYYDTDSVIFIQRSGDWLPETGSCLGDWSSEMKAGESHIVRFVSCGPKVYSYVTDTGRMELKVKGMTQNGYTEDMLAWNELEKIYERSGRTLDFDQLRRLLDGTDDELEVVYPEYLKKNMKTQVINTIQLKKKLRLVYDKRILIDGFRTIPYGMKL